MGKAFDLTGQRFGKLAVLRRGENGKPRAVRWICRCDCGRETLVISQSLRCGRTESCGCSTYQSVTTHGMHRSAEYRIWASMRQRCRTDAIRRPGHESYEGVLVCREWDESFEVFFRDMGQRPSPRHSLDRVDSSGGYCKENCRWATPDVQANNRRSNVFVEIDGERKTVAQWALVSGVNRETICVRLRMGFAPREAVFRKVKARSVPVSVTAGGVKSKSTEYRIWIGMKTRCLSKSARSYHRYGGRGIKVCQRWLDSFDSFLEDMGPRPSPKHSLDRVDNDGDYCKENCRWATIDTQVASKRTTRLIPHGGVTMPIAWWAKRCGITRKTLARRLEAGWTTEEAVTTPKIPRGLGSKPWPNP